jgi:hypothetical protein
MAKNLHYLEETTNFKNGEYMKTILIEETVRGLFQVSLVCDGVVIEKLNGECMTPYAAKLDASIKWKDHGKLETKLVMLDRG